MALQYHLGLGVEAFSSHRDSVLPFPIIRGHQVHGVKVAVAEDVAKDLNKSPFELSRDDLWGYDAIMTNVPELGIAVRTADCIPVLLYDPQCRVVAAVHAGWRGTVAYIVRKTIKMMHARYGTNPASLNAVIGPGISRASFQVGEEVVEQFRQADFPMERIYEFQTQQSTNGQQSVISENPMFGGHHIDLFEANRWVLETAGVLSDHIQVVGTDTYTDTSFFSARREGTECGRIINGIRLC